MKTIQVEGLTLRVNVVRDDYAIAPWKDYPAAHGVVVGWTSRGKRPGELVLKADKCGSKIYYDLSGSIKKALSEGWGVEKPAGKTKRQIAAEAAMENFNRLKDWADDKWWYVRVEVKLLDVMGRVVTACPTWHISSLESDDEDGIQESIEELVAEVKDMYRGKDYVTIRIRKDEAMEAVEAMERAGQ